MTQGVLKYITRGKTYGMDENAKQDEMWCSTCTQTRQTKAPATGKLVGNSPEITINSDICGPVQTETLSRKRYF